MDTKIDKVNHPSHYTWLKKLCGIEVIDITRHMGFNLGNVIKYVLRSGHKSEEGYSDSEKELEDLQKAKWYLEDEIVRMGGNVQPKQKDKKTIEVVHSIRIAKSELLKILDVIQDPNLAEVDNLVTIVQHQDNGIGIGTDLFLTSNDGKIDIPKFDVTDYSLW